MEYAVVDLDIRSLVPVVLILYTRGICTLSVSIFIVLSICFNSSILFERLSFLANTSI